MREESAGKMKKEWSSRTTIGLASLSIGLLTACTSPSGPPAARVDGHVIPLKEIDESIRDDLFRESYGDVSSPKAHEARLNKIKTLIDDYLAQTAAEQAGMTPEEWILAEAALLPPVTDELVQKLFDDNHEKFGEGVTLEQLRPQLRAFLESGQQDTVIRRLREEADVSILVKRPRQTVDATGPSLGPDTATITIVEFSDFQCPFCARAAPTVKALLERHPETVRLVYRHQPLPFHKEARPAAEAAVCADEQEKFWEYHDLLFADRKALSPRHLLAYADQLELDGESFRACLERPDTAARVEADIAEAARVGATATPAFYINGIKLSGAKPIEAFETIVQEELQRLAR